MEILELIWFMFLKTIINNNFFKNSVLFENCSYFFNLVFFMFFVFFKILK